MHKRDPLLLFFLISFLIHLFFALTSVSYLEKKKIEESSAVQVTLLNKKYQIADIEKPEHEQRPKEAKFMGMYDSTVEKEQVSTMPPSVAAKQKSESSGKEEKVQEAQKVKEGGSGISTKKPKAPEKAQKSASRVTQPQNYFDPVPGDFFPDYKRGDKTYLNVLRFPQVEYFVRLKKIFRTTFDPVPALRASVTSMQISRGQVEVKMAVSIDRSGALDELFVINSSGLLPYDKEALRTVKASSPFAKPPGELLDASSKLRMVWTFTVYL